MPTNYTHTAQGGVSVERTFANISQFSNDVIVENEDAALGERVRVEMQHDVGEAVVDFSKLSRVSEFEVANLGSGYVKFDFGEASVTYPDETPTRPGIFSNDKVVIRRTQSGFFVEGRIQSVPKEELSIEDGSEFDTSVDAYFRKNILYVKSQDEYWIRGSTDANEGDVIKVVDPEDFSIQSTFSLTLGSTGDPLTLIEAPSYGVVFIIPEAADVSNAVAVDANDKSAASISNPSVTFSGSFLGGTWSAAQDKVYVHTDAGEILAIDAGTNEVSSKLTDSSSVADFGIVDKAVSAIDGKYLWIATFDAFVEIWNVETQNKVREISTEYETASVDLTDDKAYISQFESGGQQQKVISVDLQTFRTNSFFSEPFNGQLAWDVKVLNDVVYANFLDTTYGSPSFFLKFSEKENEIRSEIQESENANAAVGEFIDVDTKRNRVFFYGNSGRASQVIGQNFFFFDA